MLERGKVGQRWRTRWESFCLVTPNWTVRLPGAPYDGDDPDGYMPRDDVVGHLERYAGEFGAPVHEGVDVTSLAPEPRGGFRLQTSAGDMLAAQSVVVCSGAYQRPHRRRSRTALPRGLAGSTSTTTATRPALPAGPVLVIGSGQSGCQLAEELHEAGREVLLACGRAPWVPRRIGDHDVFWWAVETGYIDERRWSSLPAPAARLAANVSATGPRRRPRPAPAHAAARRACRLLGHFVGAATGATSASPTTSPRAWRGAMSARAEFVDAGAKLVEERGLPEPELPDPEPLRRRAAAGARPRRLRRRDHHRRLPPRLRALGARARRVRRARLPGARRRCASSAAPGLWFAGVHFLRKRKSSLLYGVGEDAAIVARGIAAAA